MPWREITLPAVINKLLSFRIDINHRDLQGRTALIYAIIYNNELQVIKSLLDAGANVHLRERYKGITPLMYAVRDSKDPAVIYLLLEAGADPIARDYQGKRVVDYLNENSHLKGTDIYWRLHYLEPSKTRIPLETHKDPAKAGLLAAVIPSAGHYYAGNWGKGSLFLLGEITSLAIGLSSENDSTRNVFMGVFLALKAWEVYDAVKETEKYNRFVDEFNREAIIFNESIERDM